MKMQEKTGLLYDFAAANPEGFTIADACEKFGWHRRVFLAVVRALRLMFAGDSITLTCEPQGLHEPYLYKLVGTYDAARPWMTSRVGDLESRLETVHAVSLTLTNATDGRSAEGRKVRKIERTVGRLIEDLAEMAEASS